MKIQGTEAPELTEQSCREATGKGLEQWFQALDTAGGLALGRRELVQAIYEDARKDVWWSVTIVVEYERARGQKEKDGKPTGYSICSTKTIAAPLERVFQAFAQAGSLDRWLGEGTRLEFRDGGSFANSDGDRGSFKRIRANKDIRLLWERPDLAPGTAVEVLFADKGKQKTGITLNHTRIQSRREADLVRAGWSKAFDDLKALLEAS